MSPFTDLQGDIKAFLWCFGLRTQTDHRPRIIAIYRIPKSGWIHGAIQIFFSLGIGHLAAQFWAPDPGPWDMLRVVLKLVAVWRFWGCNAILGGRQIWFIQVLLKIGGSGNCKQGDISNVRRKGSIKGCFWGAWDSVVVVMLWSYDLMLHSWLVFLENFWC